MHEIEKEVERAKDMYERRAQAERDMQRAGGALIGGFGGLNIAAKKSTAVDRAIEMLGDIKHARERLEKLALRVMGPTTLDGVEVGENAKSPDGVLGRLRDATEIARGDLIAIQNTLDQLEEAL